MARLADLGNPPPGIAGGRQRRQFRAGAFHAWRERCGRGGSLSLRPRPDPASARILWSSRRLAPDGRHGRGQPCRRSGARRICGGVTMKAFNKLAIIGLGHIGSSIAHAARRGDLAGAIAGYDKSEDVRKRARAIGFATVVYDNVAEAVGGADLVILCTPVGAYKGVAAEVSPHLAQGAILSDVGSVKVAAIRDI